MSRVFVGLSGGVDSAVSAALLQKQGHSVTGVFIKIWQPEFVECTWRRDRLDAMRVCAHLGIPFREIDLSREYKREVADEMVAGYARGETPNPDILCNRSVKFGHFLRFALDSGAEKVATGHYARVEVHDGHTRLLRGTDENKDQSYFLAQLGQEELSRALFPIGRMRKPEVRALAAMLGLPNAARPDSQGLCFVGDVDMRDFLRQFISVRPGTVLDLHGTPIGMHDGAALYTIGERHGFKVSSHDAHYITATDIVANTITVSPVRADCTRSVVLLRDLHWTVVARDLPLSCIAQVRYRGDTFPITAARDDSGIRATFSTSQIAAKGQSLVLYEGNECIGSATMN